MKVKIDLGGVIHPVSPKKLTLMAGHSWSVLSPRATCEPTLVCLCQLRSTSDRTSGSQTDKQTDWRAGGGRSVPVGRLLLPGAVAGSEGQGASLG